MPEELLLDGLETADSLSERLEKLVDDLHGTIRQLGRFVEWMKGMALTYENAWRQIVTKVAKGQTAEMQAARPQLLSDFEKRLDLLKRIHALFTRYHKEGWTDLPDPDVLLPEIAGMERLKARILDHWQSADDLEELAARDYQLTTADLDRTGPQRRPPASWYAEDSKPF